MFEKIPRTLAAMLQSLVLRIAGSASTPASVSSISSQCQVRDGGSWVPAEELPGKDTTCFSGTERVAVGREE